MSTITMEERLAEGIGRFNKIFGAEPACACSVPYSVLLAGDGADLAVATDLSGLYVIGEAEGECALAAKGYTGVATTSEKLPGPYQNESETIAGVLRGMVAAFKHYGYQTKALKIYADAPTLPGNGLDEPSHLAISLAYIFNKLANGSLLSEKRLSETVQWTLANYMLLDSYATDTYSSIQGKTLNGNFKSTEKPVISEVKLDMAGCGLYTVALGTTGVDMAEEDVDPRLDSLIVQLGREPDDMTEKRFYTKLCDMDDIDKEAVLFLMDYYTQENFEKIYSANAKGGAGSPSMGQSVDFKAEKSDIPGAEPEKAAWMQLCCVSDKAKDAFVAAMEKMFGKDCVAQLNPSEKPATWLK